MSPELIPEDNSCRTKTVAGYPAEDKLLGVACRLSEKKI